MAHLLSGCCSIVVRLMFDEISKKKHGKNEYRTDVERTRIGDTPKEQYRNDEGIPKLQLTYREINKNKQQ